MPTIKNLTYEELEKTGYKTLDFIGYPTYAVDAKGKVYSLSNATWKKIIQKKTRINRFGYEEVVFYQGNKEKTFRVHRLVAEAFIPNPNNWPQVNHKDFNRSNNKLENLEWCTREYNLQHSKKAGRYEIGYEKIRKPVAKMDKDGNLLQVYLSAGKAEKDGFDSGCIGKVCKGHPRYHSHKGFVWRYATQEQIDSLSSPTRNYTFLMTEKQARVVERIMKLDLKQLETLEEIAEKYGVDVKNLKIKK